MSKCFIEGVGSGTGKLFAAIGVTYDEGAILTCTNGTKTLKAKTTTGRWVFAIPEAGTWTVTATAGTDTSSETVEITTEGQSVNVDLARYWLYKDGNQYTSVTGGWSAFYNYNAGASIGADKINIYPGAGHPSAVSSSYSIDLSKYSTLYMTFRLNSGSGVIRFGLRDSVISGEQPSFTVVTQVSPSAGEYTISCDISEVDRGHVGIYQQYGYNIDIFQIWAK